MKPRIGTFSLMVTGSVRCACGCIGCIRAHWSLASTPRSLRCPPMFLNYLEEMSTIDHFRGCWVLLAHQKLETHAQTTTPVA
eukprot:6083055-Amphidinium_carterae.1